MDNAHTAHSGGVILVPPELLGNSAENVPISATEVGDGPKKRKKRVRSRGFAFTLYYENFNMTLPEAVKFVLGLWRKKGDKVKANHEICPTTGKKHLQSYVYWMDAVEIDTAKLRINPSYPWSVHIECQKGSIMDNLQYCGKEASQIDGPWYVGIPKPREPKVLRYDELLPWQAELVEELKSEPDDRTIYWIYDLPGGHGKSRLQSYIRDCMFATEISGCQKDAAFSLMTYQKNNGYFPDTVYINLERDSKFKDYSTLECIKNGEFFSGKYESTTVVMPWPHVIVFSNELPDTNRLTSDRWNINDISDLPLPVTNFIKRKPMSFGITVEQANAKRRKLLSIPE